MDDQHISPQDFKAAGYTFKDGEDSPGGDYTIDAAPAVQEAAGRGHSLHFPSPRIPAPMHISSEEFSRVFGPRWGSYDEEATKQGDHTPQAGEPSQTTGSFVMVDRPQGSDQQADKVPRSM